MVQVEVTFASTPEDRHAGTLSYEDGERVELVMSSEALGRLSFTDDHLFGALTQLRGRLEQAGCLLLCNAARRDAYPSRMSLQMGGGCQLYIETPGQRGRLADLVDALDAATFEQVCTVAEQLANHLAWIRSLQ